MKLKKGYVVREIANEIIVVPTGEEAIHFNGIMTLNKTGKTLFEALLSDQTIESLLEIILNKYDIDKAKALQDIESFITVLKKKELLRDE
ncbi:MAG: PqqD family protein [Candidatus Izemoplasmatales bacterium]